MGRLHKLKRRFWREKFPHGRPIAVKIWRRQIGEAKYDWIYSQWSWHGQPYRKFLEMLKREGPDLGLPD